MKKHTISRITGKKITEFKIHIKIGKRTYKNATPFAAYSFIKNNKQYHFDGPVNLLNEFKHFANEYKKWKSKKLKNYSKAWQTRIKRKREEYKYFAYDFFRSINANTNVNTVEKEHHFELMGTAYFNPIDSRWNTLWPWIVVNIFNGLEEDALKEYGEWAERRWS